MKLQQEHTDTSILGENFETQSAQKSAWWKRVWTKPSSQDSTRMEKALYAGIIWLLLTTTVYVVILVGYGPGFRVFVGEVAQTREQIALLETGYIDGMKRVDEDMAQLAELRSTQALASNPTLTAVKSLREGRPAWDAVFRDVESAVKQTVESNDILQRIVLGGVNFTTDTGQGALTKVKVYANGDQSSLALAARFVQALEATPNLKNVQSSTPVTQQETASGAILTYTPLDITFSVQQDQEITPKDEDKDVQDVQKDIESFQRN